MRVACAPTTHRASQCSPFSTAHSPHPHPAAPSDIRDAFSSFQEKLASGPHFDKAALQPVEALAKGGQVGGTGGAAPSGNEPGTGGAAAASNAVEDVFDLPERFWNTPSLRWEEKEMDAVMVSAA